MPCNWDCLLSLLILALRGLSLAGHFGCVFRGLLKVPEQKTEQEVAVKTLRSFTGLYSRARFILYCYK